MKMNIQIFATKRTGIDAGYREEITDLYWFEENHIHSFEDNDYFFEVNLVELI